MQKILSEADFVSMLQCPKALVYLLVEWSGPERESRNVVYTALAEIPEKTFTPFEIDCSELDQQWVVDWLQKHSDKLALLYAGGWGTTLFVQKGEVIEYISCPFNQPAEVQAKLHEWNNQPSL